MNEKWLDVKGYEANYQVSNLGRVRSKDRKEWMPINNGYRVRKGQIIKGEIDKQGYHKIGLWKNSKCRKWFVHRLVAVAFIKNPSNLPIINHKDEDPLNNFVENLEWCDYSYNATYKDAKERNMAPQRKAIVGTCLKTGVEIKFKSSADAGRAGYTHASACARGERKQNKGYTWEYL